MSHALLLDKSTRLTSIASGEVLFAFSSIYWLSGIANLLKATYYGAIRIITTKSYSPEYFLELIEKYKITHVFASSQQIYSILKHERINSTDLSSVLSLAISGQKFSTDECSVIRKNFKNAVPYNMFGLSELGGAVAISRGFQLPLYGSGKLVNGIKIKITDENGNRFGIGERGRISVQTDYFFIGYYGKKGIESIIDQENFLNTGMIGYFDVFGYLHVLGRDDEMIKYQNVRISPKEIEQFLIQHPAVMSICVVDVPKSGDNLVTALIVRNKNFDISEDDVLKLVSGKRNDERI